MSRRSHRARGYPWQMWALALSPGVAALAGWAGGNLLLWWAS